MCIVAPSGRTMSDTSLEIPVSCATSMFVGMLATLEQVTKKGYLLEDFRLFHLRDMQRENIDYHYHEFYKLLFLVSGSGSYSVEGRRYLLKSGDVALIGSQCIHRPEFETGTPYERMILYISPDFLQRESTADCHLGECFSGTSGHVLRPDEKSRKKFSRLFSDMEEELSSDDYGSSVLCSSLLLRTGYDLTGQECYRCLFSLWFPQLFLLLPRLCKAVRHDTDRACCG